MKKLEYDIQFTTPAFLGNAEQQAQWRTPPFKALLRQWWRIIKARDFGYNYTSLLEQENYCFGAATNNVANASKVRIRLETCNWSNGEMTNWPAGEKKTKHPEVKFPIGSELYLGYGPLAYANKATTFGRPGIGQKTAIAPERETARLVIGFPDSMGAEIQSVLNLVQWFGTLGSRSRNGWGSLDVQGQVRLEKLSSTRLESWTRPLVDCLSVGWPHAIGMDDKGPLVWQTQLQVSWRDVMLKLAEAKIQFRTYFRFRTGGNHSLFEDRHILAYPVTNHNVPEWGRQARLGNQIRFKVRKIENKYFGVIFHLPCNLPTPPLKPMAPINRQVEIWQQVHKRLDQNPHLNRLK